MKISKSKQELARIISENGGWRDESESEFAAQDGDGTCSIDFFKSTPRYDKDDKYWKGEYDFCERISQSGFTIKNFHQTILSRAEYFHLYPAQDADGWIEFDGSERPSGYFNKMVDVKLQDGSEMTDSSGRFEWDTDGPSRIIAYRLHKQADPEFCESVTRAIPEPDELVWTNPPSIEQLAADYRNSLDFALRKQKEADAAKADAEAKLKALELAGEAHGLLVTPITSKQEPELVITDWRDLRVCDVVWYGGNNGLPPGEYHVMEIEVPDYEGYRTVRVNGGDGGHWIDTRAGWGFIRRP